MEDKDRQKLAWLVKATVGVLVVWLALLILVASAVQLVRGMLVDNPLLIKEGLFGCIIANAVVYFRLEVLLRSSYNPLAPDYLRNVQQAARLGGRTEVLRQQKQALQVIIVVGALAVLVFGIWKL